MSHETTEGCVASVSDKIIYVFYDFETTQNTRYTDEAYLHVPNFVLCSSSFLGGRTWKTEETACVVVRGINRSGRSVGDLSPYLTEPRPGPI